MSAIPVAIVDYGAGNLRSVEKALEHLGHRPTITADPKAILDAPAVVFPGQGIAGACMIRLVNTGLREALKQRALEDRPLFGVCLGLQLIFSWTEEGDQDCLDILPGKVLRFPSQAKVPHMGWNGVEQQVEHPLFEGVRDGLQFYFVHSYYAAPEDDAIVIGKTDYQVRFASAVARGNLVATQFHPEKSGEPGLRLYTNFLKYTVGD